MTEQLLPVLVVGAGPTTRMGSSCSVIDRGSAAATTSRALVVQPRTLEIFDDIGVV